MGKLILLAISPFISFLTTYFIVWWVVFFITIPFGNKTDKTNHVIGQASSAPDNPRIGTKILVTSIISLLLSGIIFSLFHFGIVSFREIASAS